MTRVTGRLTVPTQTGRGPATGVVHFTPRPRRQLTAAEEAVLPDPVTARLFNGKFAVELEPSRAFWYYSVFEETQQPETKYLTVRGGARANYHELETVNPETFDPIHPLPQSAQQVLLTAQQAADNAVQLINDIDNIPETVTTEITRQLPAQVENNIQPAVDNYLNRNPVPGASDEFVKNLIENPESDTRTALLGTIGTVVDEANILTPDGLASRTVINALDHGVAADGITDDAPAWNALVAAAPPGSVITWVGRSIVKDPIVWKSKVSLIGQGWGRSILASVDETGTRHFAVIEARSGNGFSETNTIQDVTFANFEVDGAGLTIQTYSIRSKALYMQFMERCQIRNLWIHDTIATGLGIDFLPGCIIDGVLAERCGRLNDGGGGSAGIGIGTGAWETEDLIISNCISRDNGKWGIFIEKQADKPYFSKGIVISNCVTTGNAQAGINDSGGDGCLIVNCISTDNGGDGFSTRYDARNGRIANCTALDNDGDGIYVPPECATGGWTIESNTVGRNGGRGIYLDANLDGMADMTVRGNDVFGNQMQGIYGDSAQTGLPFTNLIIEGNRVRGNGHMGGSAARGIKFDANIENLIVRGNRVYDPQTTKTQTVGMEFSSVAAYTLTNALIEANDFTGNGTVGFRFQAHTRSNVQVRNNLGYVTENSGTATIPDGGGTVTITHGLQDQPTGVQVTSRGADHVWVDTIGTSGGVILRRAATSGELIVDWTATYKP